VTGTTYWRFSNAGDLEIPKDFSHYQTQRLLHDGAEAFCASQIGWSGIYKGSESLKLAKERL